MRSSQQTMSVLQCDYWCNERSSLWKQETVQRMNWRCCLTQRSKWKKFNNGILFRDSEISTEMLALFGRYIFLSSNSEKSKSVYPLPSIFMLGSGEERSILKVEAITAGWRRSSWESRQVGNSGLKEEMNTFGERERKKQQRLFVPFTDCSDCLRISVSRFARR